MRTRANLIAGTILLVVASNAIGTTHSVDVEGFLAEVNPVFAQTWTTTYDPITNWSCEAASSPEGPLAMVMWAKRGATSDSIFHLL